MKVYVCIETGGRTFCELHAYTLRTTVRLKSNENIFRLNDIRTQFQWIPNKYKISNAKYFLQSANW